MIGAIEAGGTKMICGVADKTDLTNILGKISIPTTEPSEIMAAIVNFFNQFPIEAIGIGCFGPIDIDKHSATYGFIQATPKLAWRNFDFLGFLQKYFSVPMYWTTDVNVAGYAEFKYGAAKMEQHCVYLTIGTGIGGSVILDGQLVVGRNHLELGHIFVNQQLTDQFKGCCPYHGNCLEGLASGTALSKRSANQTKNLAVADSIWEVIADYLAQACVNFTLSFAPDKIILGGGVMNQQQLFLLIRKKFQEYFGSYMKIDNLDEYIVPCQLNGDAGIIGGLLLAASLEN